MKRRIAVGLLLILVSGMASAQKKKKHDQVPAVFEHAHFAYVEPAEGTVNAADEKAVEDVEDALQDWKRYALTERRREAEFVLVVRKGRAADVEGHLGGGVSLGTRPQVYQNNPANQNPTHQPGQAGPGGAWGSAGASGELGSKDDMLRVYLVNIDGTLTGPLWTLQKQNGLNAPPLLLMEELKAAVEKAYPSQPPPQPPVQNPPTPQGP